MELPANLWPAAAALAGFVLFWSWESAAPFFRFPARARHAARNLTLTALNIVGVRLLFGSAIVAAAAAAEAGQSGLLYSLPSTPVRFVFALLVLDLWAYIWHRANHRFDWLWRLHRVHHSDPAMDVSTAARFHTIEIALSAGIRIGLIAVFGLPLTALALYDAVLLASTQFHHADIALPGPLDRGLRWAIVSPNMHKIHHSKLGEEMNSNYTSILSIWDRLFGTYREREDYREIRFGVQGLESDRRQTVAGMLKTPFVSDAE